jgi:hypothetical protein
MMIWTRQSRAMSLLEAITNVVIGFLIAVFTQMLVFPLFSLQVSLTDNFLIGCIFTAVSLTRTYVLRRFFEHICVRANGSEVLRDRS